jgi:hypothetical protein
MAKVYPNSFSLLESPMPNELSEIAEWRRKHNERRAETHCQLGYKSLDDWFAQADPMAEVVIAFDSRCMFWEWASLVVLKRDSAGEPRGMLWRNDIHEEIRGSATLYEGSAELSGEPLAVLWQFFETHTLAELTDVPFRAYDDVITTLRLRSGAQERRLKVEASIGEEATLALARLLWRLESSGDLVETRCLLNS